MATLKVRIRALLGRRDFDGIAALAREAGRAFGALVALTYDREPLIAWRAVEAMGVAADATADADPDRVRDVLRRLTWLLSEESGGVCWRAPEAMAEIVRRRPAVFADYVPIIVHLLREIAEEDLTHFRVGILWAIGRLGPLAAPYLTDVDGEVRAAIDHPDPQVRGMAVWMLTRVGVSGALLARPQLAADTGAVTVYDAGALRRTTVAALSRSPVGASPRESPPPDSRGESPR